MKPKNAVVLHKVFPRPDCMQARKTGQGKIVEKKIVCRTDEQIKLVQKLVKENCSSVRGLNKMAFIRLQITFCR